MFNRNYRAWAALAVTAALFAMTGQRCLPRRTTGPQVTVTATPTSGTNSVDVTLAATVTGGTEPYTYAWTASPAATITGADTASATATVTATTVFTCTVTDADSDTDSADATVTVTTAITVTASGPSSALGGETVNLVGIVSNQSGAVSFSWLMTATGTAGTASVTNGNSQTASVTFSADATGTFTFQVTATDSVGSDTDTVSIAVSASGAGAATTFTVGTDTLTGTTGDDIFDGTMLFNSPTGTFLSTLQSADKADGLAGTDVAYLEIEAGAANVTVSPTIANIETLDITAVDTDSNAGNDTDVIYDASKTTGATALVLTNVVTDADDNQAGELNVTNLKAIPTLTIRDTSKPVGFTFGATAVEGTADAMTINLDSVTDGTVTNGTGGIETYTINSSGSVANALAAFVTTSDAATLNITGDQDLDLGAAIETSWEAVDANAFTGALTIIMADAAGDDISITGGSGDDTVTGLVAGDTVTANLGAGDDSLTIAGFTDGTDSLAGGDGTDTIILTSAVATAIATDIDDIVGFEVLGISDALAGNLDVSYITGVTDVSLDAGVNGDRSITVSTGSTVSFNADSATADDDVTILSATNGTGVAAETVTVELADTVDAGATITGDLILTGFEAATINSTEIGQQIGGALTINDDVAGAGATTVITITGDENLTITGAITADVTDASAFTGDLTATLAATSSISGGSGDDILTGSAGADTIAGNAGDDTIVAGVGADAINGGAGADTITGGMGNDSITLGAGDDILVLWDDTDDTAYTGGIETVADFTTGEDLIQIDDSAVTTNGGVGAVAEAAYYEGAVASMTAGTAYDVVVLTGTGYANVAAAEDAVAAVSTSATPAAVIFFDTTTNTVRMFWDADIATDDGLDNTATMATFSNITAVGNIGAAFAYTDFEIIA